MTTMEIMMIPTLETMTVNLAPQQILTRKGVYYGESLFSFVMRHIAGYLLLAFLICFIAGFQAMCAFFVWNVTKLFSGGRKPKIG